MNIVPYNSGDGDNFKNEVCTFTSVDFKWIELINQFNFGKLIFRYN